MELVKELFPMEGAIPEELVKEYEEYGSLLPLLRYHFQHRSYRMNRTGTVARPFRIVIPRPPPGSPPPQQEQEQEHEHQATGSREK